MNLTDLRNILGNCQRCKLHAGRTNIVFGSGPETAELMLVGEGPGAEEDLQGLPFVGRSGALLRKILKDVGAPEPYIANVVKCRPPKNRVPEPAEVNACAGFLAAQIGIVQPRVIVTLGKLAAETLLGEAVAITRTRGYWKRWRDIPLMPTFHPAYALRNPREESRMVADFQAVVERLVKQ